MSQTPEQLFDQERANIIRAKQRVEISKLDYKRALKRAKNAMSQGQIAKAIYISQPAVLKALRDAADVPDVLEGFSAASPFELCQRYAAGFITRDEMLDQLARWPFSPTPHPDEFGDYTESFDNTIIEVTDAARGGLLTDDDYEDWLERFANENK